MMGRLYADEDFPFGAVQILRTLGHDVLTVQEAGRGGSPIRRCLPTPRRMAAPFSPTTIVITNVSTDAAKRMEALSLVRATITIFRPWRSAFTTPFRRHRN
jgi:hypothetical protein